MTHSKTCSRPTSPPKIPRWSTARRSSASSKRTGRCFRTGCSRGTARVGFSKASCTPAGTTTAACHLSGRRDPYVARHHHWSRDTLGDIWEQFAKEVKADPNHPLQFRDADFHEFLIQEDLLGRRTVRMPAGTVLYRARLGFAKGSDEGQPYSGSAIGPPPADKARVAGSGGGGWVDAAGVGARTPNPRQGAAAAGAGTGAGAWGDLLQAGTSSPHRRPANDRPLSGNFAISGQPHPPGAIGPSLARRLGWQ